MIPLKYTINVEENNSNSNYIKYFVGSIPDSYELKGEHKDIVFKITQKSFKILNSNQQSEIEIDEGYLIPILMRTNIVDLFSKEEDSEYTIGFFDLFSSKYELYDIGENSFINKKDDELVKRVRKMIGIY